MNEDYISQILPSTRTDFKILYEDVCLKIKCSEQKFLEKLEKLEMQIKSLEEDIQDLADEKNGVSRDEREMMNSFKKEK